MGILLRAAALSLLAVSLARGEAVTVTLKSGGEIEGGLIRESDAELVVRLDHGSIRIPRKDVARVERRPDAPRKAAPAGERLPGWNRVVEVILAHPKGAELRQVPATVIDVGVLEHVPYVSHRFGGFELNVYGDPDHPAGYEVGVVDGARAAPEARQACLRLVRELLAEEGDRRALDALSLERDRKTQGGLVLEVTPPTAEDSYGGWWITVYDPEGLNRARATAAELDEITTAHGAVESDDPLGWSEDDHRQARPARKKPPAAAPPPPKPDPAVTPPPAQPAVRRVYRRGYYRPDGTFVRRRVRRR